MRRVSLSEDRELRRAIAKASLREGWLLAKSSGLNSISDKEIDREIADVRSARTRTAPKDRKPR